MDDAADPNLNQEQEEAELHKKLNEEEPEAIEYYDSEQFRFETQKQRETFKRWQNSLMHQNASFKTKRQGIDMNGSSENRQPSFLSVSYHKAQSRGPRNLSPH
jgi:hypothetical protein